MNRPELSRNVFRAFEATWPPLARENVGAFTYRDGAGGGSRVSAATLDGALADTALDEIETRFAKDGRDALFQIRGGEEDFDAALSARGYQMFDPVACLVAPLDRFAPARAEDGYVSWPPTAIQRKIWAEGGVGPSRIEVMMRARSPKCTLLGRLGDTPAGTGFVAIHNRVAVIHALEIALPARRQGLARRVMSIAADWARAHGADSLALQVTRANTAALALYSALGMKEVGQYHYRTKVLTGHS